MLLIIEGAKLTSMTKDTCDVIGALQIHSVGDGEGGGVQMQMIFGSQKDSIESFFCISWRQPTYEKSFNVFNLFLVLEGWEGGHSVIRNSFISQAVP